MAFISAEFVFNSTNSTWKKTLFSYYLVLPNILLFIQFRSNEIPYTSISLDDHSSNNKFNSINYYSRLYLETYYKV